jgi:hypothetical protein
MRADAVGAEGVGGMQARTGTCTLQSCEATTLMRKGAQWSATNSNTPEAERSSRKACAKTGSAFSVLHAQRPVWTQQQHA